MNQQQYPSVADPDLVGTYDARAGAGGGFVWDAVLEYRVWLHPERGAPDEFDGDDYYYPFDNYEDAFKFSTGTAGAEEPIALILQTEHLNETETGEYEHVTEERITELKMIYHTVVEVEDKYEAMSDALKQRGFALNNIVKIRVAGLDGAITL